MDNPAATLSASIDINDNGTISIRCFDGSELVMVLSGGLLEDRARLAGAIAKRLDVDIRRLLYGVSEAIRSGNRPINISHPWRTTN